MEGDHLARGLEVYPRERIRHLRGVGEVHLPDRAPDEEEGVHFRVDVLGHEEVHLRDCWDGIPLHRHEAVAHPRGLVRGAHRIFPGRDEVVVGDDRGTLLEAFHGERTLCPEARRCGIREVDHRVEDRGGHACFRDGGGGKSVGICGVSANEEVVLYGFPSLGEWSFPFCLFSNEMTVV